MLALPLTAWSLRGLCRLGLMYSASDGSVGVDDDVKTASIATPPQRRKSMPVSRARVQAACTTAITAALSLDLDGEGEDRRGHAEDSDTKVLMRR